MEEGRRGKGSSARRIASLGKENICPSLLRSSKHAGTTKSPLPEGYSRVPLQDITDVLQSPPIVCPGDGADQAGLDHDQSRRKRSKWSVEAQISSISTRCKSQEGASELVWTGLRPCMTRETVKTKAHLHHTAEVCFQETKEARVEAYCNLGAGVVASAESADPAPQFTRIEDVKDLPKRGVKPNPSSTSSVVATRRSSLRSAEDKAKPRSSVLKFR